MTGDNGERIVDIIDNAEPFDDGVPPDLGYGDGDEPPQDPPPAVDPEHVRFCAALDQNDTDNGKRLLTHFGQDVLHVREIGWHAWIGTHWDPDGGPETLERNAQETARRIKLEAAEILPSEADKIALQRAERLADKPPDELSDAEKEILKRGMDASGRLSKRRGDRRKFAVSCGNRARTVAMIAQALPHCSVAPRQLDADHMLLNVRNGTLAFRKEVRLVPDPDCPDPDTVRFIPQPSVGVELRDHRREDLIAKVAEVSYDRRARCPKFMAFLRRFQPDRAQRKFLQTAAGRALLGGASTQVLIFLYGDGANGKSVFMETIVDLLGAYAGRLKPESISGALESRGDQANPDFARLAGKRFVAIAELPRGAQLREGLVKTMTGGEPMPVRHLNKGFFDLLPEFIPFMSGNDLPEVGGLDHGIWRRLKFVHWPVKIPEAEQRNLKDVVGEFLEEGPGILNWMVEGALRFLRDGLQEPASVSALTSAHREELDPVGAFVKACVRPKEDGEVQARAMFEAFESFCSANAIRPWKETAFGRAMKKKGFLREDKRIRKWLNVELFDVPMRSEPPPRSPSSSEDYV